MAYQIAHQLGIGMFTADGNAEPSARSVDHLTGKNLAEYDKVHEEFMEAFENEEQLQNKGKLHKVDKDNLLRTRIMRRVWETGGFFYFHALESTTGLFNLRGRNIQLRFSDVGNLDKALNRLMAPY